MDTSVWIRHFRASDSRLIHHLKENRVATCRVVMMELMLGTGLSQEVFQTMKKLPFAPDVLPSEAEEFIHRHARTLIASAIGWADVHIICSAIEAGALLYTHDAPLKKTWRALGFRLP